MKGVKQNVSAAVLGIVLLSLTFFDIDFFFFIITICFFALIILYKVNKNKIINRSILEGKKIDTFKVGMEIYIINKSLMGNYNVAFVRQASSSYIFIEERVYNTLKADELKAIIYHEIGHSKENPIILSSLFPFFGVYLLIIGLHSELYGNLSFLVCLLLIICGASIFYLNLKLQQINEYKADEYAIKQGCIKDCLINALMIIDNMNKKQIVSDNRHPKLIKRLERINKIKV